MDPHSKIGKLNGGTQTHEARPDALVHRSFSVLLSGSVTSMCPLAEHARRNPISDAPHQAQLVNMLSRLAGISILLVIVKHPAAAGRLNRDAIGVLTIQADPDAERVRQIAGLVDPIRAWRLAAGHLPAVRGWGEIPP